MRFYRPLGPVKAMTFDLDDTLYNNGPVIRAAEVALKEYLSKHYQQAALLTAANWQSIKYQLISDDPRLASDMGQLRMRSLEQALGKDVTQPEALKAAAQACFDCFYTARSQFGLAEDVHHTLAELATRIPLLCITNGNVDTQATGLSRYFPTVLHASLERPMKPSRHMFDEAVRLLDVPAEQILHVGDNLEKDVYGAVAAGMQSAWFACNRPMDIRTEAVRVLPHVELARLDELHTLL